VHLDFVCNRVEIDATSARNMVPAMRAILLALVILFIAVLAGCGQEQQQTGIYQGKADAAPWDSPERGGAQATWERAIQARTENQNEYARMR
jgi:ABC-type uncharacterized transport system auxiliary subunit